MQLRLTHLKGPLQGEHHLFDEETREIRFGRSAVCEVQFPPEFDSVSSNVHCVLVKDVSKYEVRVQTDYRVLVNGKEVFDGYELQQGDELTVGSKDNPAVLSVEFIRPPLTGDSVVARMLKTARQGHSQTKDDAEYLARAMSKIKRLGVIAVVLALVGGAALFLSYQNDRKIEATRTAFQETIRKRKLDFRDAIAATEESVYLVLIVNSEGEDTPAGTAWVTEDGYLATNAHVAESISAVVVGAQNDRNAVVRLGKAPYTEHRVTGTIIHPAYSAFEEAWRAYNPLRVDSDGGSTYDFAYGYDVALLEVADSKDLGPPLPLASEKVMQNLKRGYPVAFNGFPMERLHDVDTKKPISNAQTGIITTITDFFRTSSFNPAGELIHHSLPSTGGASGSPIFNKDGEVIGLLNAGNVFIVDIYEDGIKKEEQRLPNAASINFAQRVDLLKDLLSPNSIDMESLRESWEEGLANFETPESYARKHLLNELVDDWARSVQARQTPFLLNHDTFNIVPTENRYTGSYSHATRLDVDHAGYYLLVAESSSDPLRDIDLMVLDENIEDVENFGDHILVRNIAFDHIPVVTLDLQEPQTLFAYVTDGRLGADIERDPAIVSKVEFHVYYIPFE